MGDLSYDLNSWIRWTISVVVVGIAINLISTFLYPKLEKKYAKYSAPQRQKIQEREQELNTQAEVIKSDPNKLLELKIDIIRLQLNAACIVAVGLLAINIYPILVQGLYLYQNNILGNFLGTIILSGHILIPLVTLIVLLPVLNATRYYKSLLSVVDSVVPNPREAKPKTMLLTNSLSDIPKLPANPKGNEFQKLLTVENNPKGVKSGKHVKKVEVKITPKRTKTTPIKKQVKRKK